MAVEIKTRRVRRGSGNARTTIDGFALYHQKGNIYYVDTNMSTGGDGLTWGSAFKTMQAAFNVLVGGETIYVVGDVREQLVTPVQIFDVSVIGAGNFPP